MTQATMSPVTKDPSIILGNSSERWNVDQLFQYLTYVAGWPEGEAIAEMQEKFERERLPLQWRRTDPECMDREGVIPGSSFLKRQLCVARDFNSDKKHGPIDIATYNITAGNDGRAFIQVLRASVSATYELTIPAWLARSLWPPRLTSKEPALTTDHSINQDSDGPRYGKAIRPVIEAFKQLLECGRFKNVGEIAQLTPAHQEKIIKSEFAKKRPPRPPANKRTIGRAVKKLQEEPQLKKLGK
jgi:hypothetical protein